MKPQRIQRKRIKGWKKPPNTIYVGRGSKFGNPFMVGRDAKTVFLSDFDYKKYRNKILTREDAVHLYKKYFTVVMLDYVPYLKGKNLMCWCPLDEPCHADVLLKLVNKN